MTQETESPSLPWPPPGIDRMRGDLWTLARTHLLGALLLIVPFFVILRETDPFRLGGGLGEAWWVLPVTTAMALLVLTGAYVGTFRFLRRAAGGARLGYGWGIVGLVASDQDRDMALLVGGSGYFSRTSPSTRAAIRTVRVAAAMATLLGAMWLSAGFALGVFLANRGLVGGPGELAFFTLGPAGLLLIVGAALILGERMITREIRRTWYRSMTSAGLESEAAEAAEWRARLAGSPFESPPPAGGATRAMGFGAAGVLLVGALVVLPAVALSGMLGISTLMTSISAPRYMGVSDRIARAEPLRGYRVEPDPTITAAEAGEILNVLRWVDGEPNDPYGWLRPPLRRYDRPWLEDARRPDNPTGISPQAWDRELFSLEPGALGPEAIAFLEEVTAHPAGAEFRRLAYAPALDGLGGTLRSPLPAGSSVGERPSFMSGTSWRTAAQLHAARAFLLHRAGQVGEARTALEEIISVGFLLLDESTVIEDQFMGSVVLGVGGNALRGFLDRSGSADEAAALERSIEATARALARSGQARDLNAQTDMTSLVESVTDTTALRGLRWGAFLFASTFAPCYSPRLVLFGGGEAHAAWEEEARRSLVRYPSEEEFFERAREGYFGHPLEELLSGRLARAVSRLGGSAAGGENCGGVLQLMLLR